MDSFPDKYLPVSESSLCNISTGVPWKTISLPVSGARAHIDNMIEAGSYRHHVPHQHGIARSRSFFKVSISRKLSLWCSPTVGSSSTYKTPLTRTDLCGQPDAWLSPPDKDRSISPSLNNPCDIKQLKAVFISLIILSVIFISCGDRVSCSKKTIAFTDGHPAEFMNISHSP